MILLTSNEWKRLWTCGIFPDLQDVFLIPLALIWCQINPLFMTESRVWPQINQLCWRFWCRPGYEACWRKWHVEWKSIILKSGVINRKQERNTLIIHQNADLNQNLFSLLLKPLSGVTTHRTGGSLLHRTCAAKVKDLPPSVRCMRILMLIW